MLSNNENYSKNKVDFDNLSYRQENIRSEFNTFTLAICTKWPKASKIFTPMALVLLKNFNIILALILTRLLTSKMLLNF